MAITTKKGWISDRAGIVSDRTGVVCETCPCVCPGWSSTIHCQVDLKVVVWWSNIDESPTWEWIGGSFVGRPTWETLGNGACVHEESVSFDLARIPSDSSITLSGCEWSNLQPEGSYGRENQPNRPAYYTVPATIFGGKVLVAVYFSTSIDVNEWRQVEGFSGTESWQIQTPMAVSLWRNLDAVSSSGQWVLQYLTGYYGLYDSVEDARHTTPFPKTLPLAHSYVTHGHSSGYPDDDPYISLFAGSEADFDITHSCPTFSISDMRDTWGQCFANLYARMQVWE